MRSYLTISLVWFCRFLRKLVEVDSVEKNIGAERFAAGLQRSKVTFDKNAARVHSFTNSAGVSMLKSVAQETSQLWSKKKDHPGIYGKHFLKEERQYFKKTLPGKTCPSAQC